VLRTAAPHSTTGATAPIVTTLRRKTTKVKAIQDIDLAAHTDWPSFVADYRIAIIK